VLLQSPDRTCDKANLHKAFSGTPNFSLWLPLGLVALESSNQMEPGGLLISK
jgi:hypothetical protein